MPSFQKSVENLDPKPKIPEAHRIKELRLTIAYSKKDSTYGWSGFSNAMRLYYMSQQEHFAHKDHGYPLVDGLSPFVSFSVIQTKLLGKPFTECERKANYTERSCQEFKIMKQIYDRCGCYPE